MDWTLPSICQGIKNIVININQSIHITTEKIKEDYSCIICGLHLILYNDKKLGKEIEGLGRGNIHKAFTSTFKSCFPPPPLFSIRCMEIGDYTVPVTIKQRELAKEK